MQNIVYQRLDRILKGVLSGDYKWNENNITTTCEKVGYQVNGSITYRTTKDLISEAVYLKRSGDYFRSLKNYLDVIEGTLSIRQGIPAEVVWPMCKVLAAANQYLYAFLLLNSCEDVLMPYYGFFDNEEKYTLKNITDIKIEQREKYLTVLFKDKTRTFLQTISLNVSLFTLDNIPKISYDTSQKNVDSFDISNNDKKATEYIIDDNDFNDETDW